MKLCSLIIVSLLTAILWRVELHFRWGWSSLDWIGPFHWAFPLGMGIFLAWMAAMLKDKDHQSRNFMLAVTFILGPVAYFGGSTTLIWAYSRRWLRTCPQWQDIAILFSPGVLYAILGLAYFLVVNRLCSPNRFAMRTGAIVYAAAFPTAILLLWATSHIGGHNTINAIKSGFVFPIAAFGLGLPLTKENHQSDVPAGDAS